MDGQLKGVIDMSKKKLGKGSVVGISVGSVVGIAGIVIAIVTGKKRKKYKRLKEHPTKYKPL